MKNERPLGGPFGLGQFAITDVCLHGCSTDIHTVGYLQLLAPNGLWVVDANGRHVAMEVVSRVLESKISLSKATHLSRCKGSTAGIAAVSVPSDFYPRLLEAYCPTPEEIQKRVAVRRFSPCGKCGHLRIIDMPEGAPGKGEYDVPKPGVAKPITAFLRDQGQLCSCR